MMNGEPANKSYKIEAYNLEEKSFQSFHSSATSLIKGEISRNEIKFTPLSHRRNKSSNTLSNSHIDNMIANAENSINYFQELDQPGNKPIKFDLQKLYNLNRAAKKLNKDYEKLKRSKSSEEKTLGGFKNKDIEDKKSFNYTYNYKSHLNGLNGIIEEFFKRTLNQHQSLKYLRTMSIQQLPKNLSVPIIKNESHFNLENLYSTLGHETYTKLIRIFEKYSLYGRTHTNLSLDYTQFTTFLTANGIYNDLITKSQAELIFNKVRASSKAINFEEFVLVLIQMSRLTHNWETNPSRSLTYFINKHIVNITCLQKNEEERNMERFYFFLENEEFQREIKKHLSYLYKIFLKYKVKDLKVGDFTDTANFLKMCKDFEIIPVFLSAKEIIYNINFVKYRKKNLTPTQYLEFCQFVEIICIIALRAFNKYLNEQTKRNYFEHVEKLKIFLNHIKEKSS